LKGRKK